MRKFQKVHRLKLILIHLSELKMENQTNKKCFCPVLLFKAEISHRGVGVHQVFFFMLHCEVFGLAVTER